MTLRRRVVRKGERTACRPTFAVTEPYIRRPPNLALLRKIIVHLLFASRIDALTRSEYNAAMKHNGRRYRLTDVAGNVLTKILA